MSVTKKQFKKYFLLAFMLGFLGMFSSQNTVSAQSSSDLPFGGMVSVMSPALAIQIDENICRLMQFTAVEVTVTTSWSGDTDQGSDKTFTLLPNYSPDPSPATFRLESSVVSKTPDSAQQGKWVLGLYQQEYKKVGTCSVTTTVTYPPVSVTVDIPYYLNMGKITMYGASNSGI